MSGSDSKPTRVAEALAGYLAESGLGDRLEEIGALDDWEERVGERIAAVTEPLRIHEGTLLVAVRSSAWLMELRMMEVEIRRRLNEDRQKGRIQRIRFVQEGDAEDGQEGGAGPRRRGRSRP